MHTNKIITTTQETTPIIEHIQQLQADIKRLTADLAQTIKH